VAEALLDLPAVGGRLATIDRLQLGLRSLELLARPRVVVTAHVHVSYDRDLGDVRLVGPGSVGRPYEGARGARWALLGPGVELRRTEYDYEATADLYRASGIPDVEQEVQILLEPPTRAEIIAHAETVVFAG